MNHAHLLATTLRTTSPVSPGSRVVAWHRGEETEPDPTPRPVSSDPRIERWRDQLLSVTYPSLAGEFIRYRDDPNDEVIGAVVREVLSQGDEAAADLRRDLDETTLETLRLFSMRRTLQGRRRASLGALAEAMGGFALFPSLEEVPWESWLKSALFVGRSLGADARTVAANFRALCDGDGDARLDVAVDSMTRVASLAQCHIAEVSTTYGAGFVETLVFRGSPTMGMFGAPHRLGDNAVTFAPTANLAQLAASVADAYDAAGFATTPLGQDQLAATAFSLSVPGSYVTTTGCLSCVADGANGAASFNVVIAELPDEVDVDELARAASDTADQRALVNGQQLIVLSTVPDFDGGDELDADLGPYVDVAAAVLHGPVARPGAEPS